MVGPGRGGGYGGRTRRVTSRTAGSKQLLLFKLQVDIDDVGVKLAAEELMKEVLANFEKAIKDKGKGEEILAAVKKQLISDPGRYAQPMLLDQLEYFYSNLIRADQRPGQDAYDRYEELNSALQEQIKKLEQ